MKAAFFFLVGKGLPAALVHAFLCHFQPVRMSDNASQDLELYRESTIARFAERLAAIDLPHQCHEAVISPHQPYFLLTK
jgi:hypothetical protein